jgi:hypothetical protein
MGYIERAKDHYNAQYLWGDDRVEDVELKK